MKIIILVVALLWAIHKWIFYQLTVKAILLYYAECGVELPEVDTIQKYRIEVATKSIKH